MASRKKSWFETVTHLAQWFGISSFGARAGRVGSVSGRKTVAPHLVEALHASTSYAQVFIILAVVLVIDGSAAMAAVSPDDGNRSSMNAAVAGHRDPNSDERAMAGGASARSVRVNPAFAKKPSAVVVRR